MTWKVKEKDKRFIVFKPNAGSFTFNNRFDAERLCEKLNRFNGHWEDVGDELISQGKGLISLGEELKKLGDVRL